jgi:hypothetical protein
MQRNYNFTGNSTCKCGSGLCTLYFINKLSDVFPISAETSLSTLRTLHHSDISPEEIIASRLLKKVSLIEKRMTKYTISKTFFHAEGANNIEEKRKKQRRNKFQQQRNGKCKHFQYVRSTKSQNAGKKSIKTRIYNQEESEHLQNISREFWKNYLQTNKKGNGIVCVSCRNWLHDFCST